MRTLRPGLLLASLCFAMLPTAPAAEPVVRLCADQWMPYNGDPADPKPGYVIELARTIFEPQGIKIDYSVQPWADALAAVKAGEKSGAIGANKDEGEGLTLPSEPIGTLAVCLITRGESTWTYENLASFRKVTLGVTKGYSYWPALDTYIERGLEKAEGIFAAEGDEPLEELMAKLQAGEIDVVAESEPILLWYFRSHNIDRSKFRVVYKGPVDPIFIAFAPNAEGARFAKALDEGIRALRASGELTKLLQRYGLRDWQ